MAVISVGSLWTSNSTGHVYEIVATTPEILYSPITTYSTTIANSRIFARKPDDFLSRFTAGLTPPPSLTYARLATDGHSFADYEDGLVGGPPQIRRRQNRGVGGWLQLLSGGRITFPLSRNFGVGGQTSQLIAERVATTIANSADCAGFLIPGSLQINDRGGANRTLQQSIDFTTTYFDALVATGKPIFYVNTTPRDATAMTGTDVNGITQTDNFLAFQNWERTVLPARYGNKIVVSDVFEQMVDSARSPRVSPIGGTAGGARAPTGDGTHPYGFGAELIALDLLPKITATAAAGSLTDPIAAMLAGRTNLVVNPTLSGTTGTNSGSGTPFTGTVPSNVNQTHPANHVVTVTAQKTTSTGTWYEISDVYNGTAVSDGPESTLAIGAIADGDTVQWAVEVEWDASTAPITEFAAGLRIGTSGTSFISAEGYRSTTVDFIATSAFSGVYLCEPVTITGLGASTPTFMVRAAFGAGTAGSTATWRIRRPTLVKIS